MTHSRPRNDALDADTCPDHIALRKFLDLDGTEPSEGPIAVHLNGCEVCQEIVRGILTDSDAAIVDAKAPVGYVLLERLGEGGMGVVWKAEQENPRRLVAIKFIQGRRPVIYT